jgi:hypothetical protein
MAYVNIAALTTINGCLSTTPNISTTGTIVLSAPPTNHTYKLNTLMAVNKTTNPATITVAINRNTTNYTILSYQITVPVAATLILIGKDNPLYMYDVTTDVLSAQAGTSSAIDIIASYEDLF